MPLFITTIYSNTFKSNSLNTIHLDSFSSKDLPQSASGPDIDLGTPVSGYEREKLQDLGEIEVTNFQVYDNVTNSGNFIFNSSGDISYYHEETDLKFMYTVENASVEISKITTPDFMQREANVTIRLNETVKWEYNENATEYTIGYRPYMQMGLLFMEVYLNNTKMNASSFYQDIYNEKTVMYYNFTEQALSHPSGELEGLTRCKPGNGILRLRPKEN